MLGGLRKTSHGSGSYEFNVNNGLGEFFSFIKRVSPLDTDDLLLRYQSGAPPRSPQTPAPSTDLYVKPIGSKDTCSCANLIPDRVSTKPDFGAEPADVVTREARQPTVVVGDGAQSQRTLNLKKGVEVNRPLQSWRGSASQPCGISYNLDGSTSILAIDPCNSANTERLAQGQSELRHSGGDMR